MAMRQHQLWLSEEPPQEALQSTQPFCFDTLSFNQWLQFVFIARLHQIIEFQNPLPQRSGIVAIAEENFKGAGFDASSIIRCLFKFDALISDQANRN